MADGTAKAAKAAIAVAAPETAARCRCPRFVTDPRGERLRGGRLRAGVIRGSVERIAVLPEQVWGGGGCDVKAGV
ncbi:hypothetical protein [Streptomyces beihaiensis]|uniref:Uncharacterized protein n=1 Tax=Streptomyces beihaiensis TaxID=2984495 RepID=A0ABT3TP48_9ACTN|nr:hypothetical protein [Streptomyces beihaiensis]MCX3058781.1 hypothetical protein [Streptomyces beihaiensis]